MLDHNEIKIADAGKADLTKDHDVMNRTKVRLRNVPKHNATLKKPTRAKRDLFAISMGSAHSERIVNEPAFLKASRIMKWTMVLFPRRLSLFGGVFPVISEHLRRVFGHFITLS